MRGWRVLLLIATALGAPLTGAALDVFQDPSDTGNVGNIGVIGSLPIGGGPQSYHLYLFQGLTPSTDPDPNNLCNLADGDELCGWDLDVVATGAVTFTAADIGLLDVVLNFDPNVDNQRMRLNGGNPIDPIPGAEKLISVTAQATGPGTIEVQGKLVVLADLTTVQVATPAAPIVLVQALVDSDGDGLVDVDDLCPDFASPNNTDTNGDGFGDVCQCGDVLINASFVVDVFDCQRMSACSVGLSGPGAPDCDASKGDTDNDGDIDVFDAQKCSSFGVGLGGITKCDFTCARMPSTAGLGGCP